MIIEFKEEYMKEDYQSKIDRRIHAILYSLIGYLYNMYGDKFTILVTDTIRSDEEHKKIYEGKVVPDNIHATGRAIDIIIKSDIKLISQEAEKYCNSYFTFNSVKNTALFHNVGCGDHLHIQVSGVYDTKIIKEV